MFRWLTGGGGKNEEARTWVGQGAVLLDVRTREEHAGGHIEGSKNIPVQELGKRIGELPEGKRIVVYCRSGGRSASAAQMLRSAGFEVLDIGPMSAW
jgi:phage shock protein E